MWCVELVADAFPLTRGWSEFEIYSLLILLLFFLWNLMFWSNLLSRRFIIWIYAKESAKELDETLKQIVQATRSQDIHKLPNFGVAIWTQTHSILIGVIMSVDQGTTSRALPLVTGCFISSIHKRSFFSFVFSCLYAFSDWIFWKTISAPIYVS